MRTMIIHLQNAMIDLRLAINELLREIGYRVRGSTWRDVWAWFTYGSGARLFVAIGFVLYLLYTIYRIT